MSVSLTAHTQSAACSANRHGANENFANREDDQCDQTRRAATSAVSGARSAIITAEHLQQSSDDKQCTPPDFDEV